MEGDNHSMDMGVSGAPGPVNSRWNPTKEQIGMLENLYKQGIRTPSAEQIQQITSRLKAFGHIEGKNVFYWFQNHKARQRQKQKQESMAYINRFLHKTHQPVFAPPCPNVPCSPYYIAQSNLGFYQQSPKVLLPPGIGFRRRSRAEKIIENPTICASSGYEPALPHEFANVNATMPTVDMNQGNAIDDNKSYNSQETLPLFPLQPTWILQGGRPDEFMSSCFGSVCTDNSMTTPSGSSEITSSIGIEEGSGRKPFYDFFSEHGHCESD